MTTAETATAQSALTVTIVGAGTVGTALGTNLLGHGHRVRYAVRDVAAGIPAGASTVPIDGAAVATDLTILAVPFGAVGAAVPRLHLPAESVLVDATNPFGAPVPDGHPSGAAFVQSLAGERVHVVKTFNVLGVEHMASPALPNGTAPVLPVAADNDRVRDRVVRLARQMGFDAVPVGGLANAAALEHAALYWELLAVTGGLGREMVLVAHRRSRSER